MLHVCVPPDVAAAVPIAWDMLARWTAAADALHVAVQRLDAPRCPHCGCVLSQGNAHE
jgi:hypothetical protein